MKVTEAADRPRRLEWQSAVVSDIVVETPRVKSLVLNVHGWKGHLPGQHVDIRLTAEDGYQAQRSYSIASPPEDESLRLTVEEVADGEVSPYLVRDLRLGDRLELRGPIGGYFVWTVAIRGPLCLVAGGSGIAPLMAMLRHRERRGRPFAAALLYSSRTFQDIIYREELETMMRSNADLRVVHTLTRSQPTGWMGPRRRIDTRLLEDSCFSPEQNPHIFVCGPTSFVETAADLLVKLGHDPSAIKTERFGPTGG
jgi:ferredoxin-NADP reductase